MFFYSYFNFFFILALQIQKILRQINDILRSFLHKKYHMSINLSAMTNMGPLNLMLVDIYGKLYILQNIGYVAVRGKSIDAMR